MTYEVEEDFARPVTGIRMPPPAAGDGLGPLEVWMDQASRIADTDGDGEGDSVLLSDSGAALGGFAVREKDSVEPHAFAEALVRNDLTVGTSYNFEVSARVFMTGGQTPTTKAYFLKLRREPGSGADDALLEIGRSVGMSAQPLTSLILKDSNQPKCPSTGLLPLEEDEILVRRPGSASPCG